jgi:hypothetical protein
MLSRFAGAEDVLRQVVRLVGDGIREMKKPEAVVATSLVLQSLWKIQEMLTALLKDGKP